MPRIKRTPSYAIIGDGRAARHFRRYLTLRGIAFKAWRCGGKQALEAAIRSCPVVLLLIKDDAIASFIKAHPALRQKRLVHFSGSLVVPGVAGLHPLVSFGPKLLSLREYESIAFIMEKDGPTFGDIFPRLKNPSYAVARAKKPYYHALCVMAGNFSVLLWQKLFAELGTLTSAPASAAVPYLASVFENLLRDSSSALTGPFARKDFKTIERNLAALKRERDSFFPIYRAFAKVRAQEA